MPLAKKSKVEDLDFQMEFYEGILKENPDFVEALIALGEIYTRKGLYQKGLRIDRRLALLRPDNPIVHYNLACSLSLMGDLGNSYKALRRAIALGYDDFTFMKTDPDLANLRQDSRFDRFLKRLDRRSHQEISDVRKPR